MKNVKKIFLLLAFLLVMIGVSQPTHAEASNENQFTGGGRISFYGEASSSSTEPSTTDTEESTTTQTSSGGTLPSTSGKLPKTGELVQTSMVLSGLLIMLIAIVFLIRKRREKES